MDMGQAPAPRLRPALFIGVLRSGRQAEPPLVDVVWPAASHARP